MSSVRIEGRRLFVDGKPLSPGRRRDPLLAPRSRTLGPSCWTQPVELELTFVSTYICWQFHETEEGVHDFSDRVEPRRHVERFLVLAHSVVSGYSPGRPFHLRGMAQPGRTRPRGQPAEERPRIPAKGPDLDPRRSGRAPAPPGYARGPVILVQADNESDPAIHIHGEALGLGSTSGPFQAWLRERYGGDVQTLNATWDANLADFEEARASLVDGVPGRRRGFPGRVRLSLPPGRRQCRVCTRGPARGGHRRASGAQHLARPRCPGLVGVCQPGRPAWHRPLPRQPLPRQPGRTPLPPGTVPLPASPGPAPVHRRIRGPGYGRVTNGSQACSSRPTTGWRRSRPWPRTQPAGTGTCWSTGTAGSWPRYNRADWSVLTWGGFQGHGAGSPPARSSLPHSRHLVCRGLVLTPRPGLRRPGEGRNQDEVLVALDRFGAAFDFLDVDRDRTTTPPVLLYTGPWWLSRKGQEGLLAYLERGGTLVFHRTWPLLDEDLTPLNLLDLPTPDGTGHPAEQAVAVEIHGPPGDHTRAHAPFSQPTGGTDPGQGGGD